MNDIHDFEPLWNDWYFRELLGSGSYGDVYRVQREMHGHVYEAAVKHISIPKNEEEYRGICEEFGTDDPDTLREYFDDSVQSVMSEYTQLNDLQGQTNIVTCDDIISIPKKDIPGYDLFIRMELLESVSKRIIDGKMTRDETIKMGMDICSALKLLKDIGIIHRDIKPQNIFINRHGDYKLGDFGTARSLQGLQGFSSVKGTFSYMSPEIFSGKQVSFTADLYSLGLVMYRMMNGNRSPLLLPTQAGTATTLDKANTRRLMGEPLPSPANADSELSAIILKACAFDPEDRWQDPSEMYDALNELNRGTSYRPPAALSEADRKLEAERARKKLEDTRAREKAEKEREQNDKAQSNIRLGIIITSVIAAIILLFVGIRVVGSVRLSNEYKNAVQLVADGKYEEAIVAFDKLADYSDAKEKVESTRKLQKFSEAEGLLERGEYEKALAAFNELGNYPGAAENAQRAKDGIEKRDNDSRYEYALGLMEESRYQDALEIFAELSDAGNVQAKVKATECQRYIDFEAAGNKADSGDYKGAIEMFKELASYNFIGAAEAVKDTENRRDYAAAEALLKEKKYADAIKAFNELGAYSDALSKKSEAQSLLTKSEKYEDAMTRMNRGEYAEAKNILDDISTYEDAKQKSALCQQWLDYEEAETELAEKRFDNAEKIFTALAGTGFEDAEARVAEVIRARTLFNAGQQLANGSYEAVLTTLASLGEEDPEAIAFRETAEKKIAFRAASALLEQGQYDEAKDAFEALGTFDGADQKAVESVHAKAFAEASALLDEEKYTEAAIAFEALGNYPGAAGMAEKARNLEDAQSDYDYALDLEGRKEYQKAKNIFDNLKTFKDAKSHAENCRHGMDYQEAEADARKGDFSQAETILSTVPDDFHGKSDLLANIAAYREAAALWDSGSWSEAGACFASLGDFADASARKQDCDLELRYAEALAKMENDPSGAKAIFDSLNGLHDSVAYSAECQQAIDYASAVNLLNTGNLSEAKSVFISLRDYRDSAEKAKSCQDQIELKEKEAVYQEAESLRAAGKLSDASVKYASLGDYKDSKSKAVETSNEAKYQDALALQKAEKYADAANAFQRLGDYRDSATRAASCDFEAFCISASGGKGQNAILRNAARFFYDQNNDSKSDWAKALVWGSSDAAEIVASFLTNPGYKNIGLSDTEKVNALYRVLLNREPDEHVPEYVRLINNGMSVGYVANSFLGSDEFARLCERNAISRTVLILTDPSDQNPALTEIVVSCYRLALNRPADPEGLNAWCSSYLNGECSVRDIIKNMMLSPELEGRNLSYRDYVDLCFMLILGREEHPKDTETAVYIGMLASGYSHAVLIDNFVGSDEFMRRLTRLKLH